MKHTDKKGTPERPHYKWDGGETYWSSLSGPNHDYKYSYNCSEPCLVEDDQLNETRIRTEALGNDIRKYGRIRGNMQYLEDLWDVEIRPLNLKWAYIEGGNTVLPSSVNATVNANDEIVLLSDLPREFEL
jgi:hypothetical protein